MAKKIKVDDIGVSINAILQSYGKEVTAAIEPIIERVAKKTVERLKTTGGYQDRTKKYRRSFKHIVSKGYKGAQGVIYSSAPNYRITHLLENGHLTRNGTSRVKAYPHWAPAEEVAIKDFESELIQGIEEAGTK